MSLDTYHKLKVESEAGAHQYMAANFDSLFAEAIERFATHGWTAIGMGVIAVLLAFGSWWWLRKRLPWGWAWLLPVIGFTLYVGIKASVVSRLIILAPELPQMWELYFRYLTPYKMLRTSTSGLVITTIVLWSIALWSERRKNRHQIK